MSKHFQYLKRALELAELSRGFCAPNPCVGVVVVKHGQIIATGTHAGAGKAHAEAEALNQLSLAEAHGACVYVTLEPCCHHGKTPPCTQLLIDRGIKTVYFGFLDPNPLVCGQGKKELEAAGIPCIHLEMPDIHAFYQSYAYWMAHQRPWVTAKLALSLDGKIAGAGGARIAITGTDAQRFTHQWRKRLDALLTTLKTVLQDDPQLNVRLDDQIIKKPVYILDKQLAFPLTAKLRNTAEHITLFHAADVDEARKNELQAAHITCVQMPLIQNQLDINAVLSYIGRAGVHDLLLEAGGTCFEAFATQQAIHRAFIYVALKWLGQQAQTAFPQDTHLFTHAHHLKWHVLGDDVACEFDLSQ